MRLLSVFCQFNWLWLPVVLVLATRSMVAPGWMIEREVGGTLTVRICSDVNNADKTVEIPFERSGQESDDKPPCAWGALADAASRPASLDYAVRAATLVSDPVPLGALDFAPGAASPLPPSTGPPAFA